ncbi:MAG: helix-turn-helix transcriptional regulator [Ruminococcaceae bacterium]|nr:helix-turn-helix transcriptional regulator [Oscillospiraceae bacterium]
MENRDLIKNAVKYINNLGANTTTLDDVAKNAGFSTDYFNRIFRNYTGFNVMEYVKFRKLNRAARMLRTAHDRDILSIALDSGYESHEGFTRAFKEQYGKTPSEYRENMKGKQLVWADNELNATAVAEFRRVLPDFVEMDSDEAIDWLLEKDAKRYGYTAVTIAINGSKIVSDIGSFENGFLTIDNFFEDPYLTLVLDDLSNLRNYIDKLLLFNPDHIDCIFHKDVTFDDVKATLDGIKIKNIEEKNETMYFGEPFVLPKEAQKYDIHVLQTQDLEAVDEFIAGYPDETFKKTGGFGLKNLLKKPLEQRPLSQPFGVFCGKKLLSISYDGLQSTHGFCLNNCVHTPNLPDTPKDAIKYLYLTATNAAMEKGYIPFEDAQFGEYAKRHGEFDAFDLGFEKVNTVYSIDF